MYPPEIFQLKGIYTYLLIAEYPAFQKAWSYTPFSNLLVLIMVWPEGHWQGPDFDESGKKKSISLFSIKRPVGAIEPDLIMLTRQGMHSRLRVLFRRLALLLTTRGVQACIVCLASCWRSKSPEKAKYLGS
jgi:hypothetical protein